MSQSFLSVYASDTGNPIGTPPSLIQAALNGLCNIDEGYDRELRNCERIENIIIILKVGR
jgi:hypothetical protein